MISKFDHLFFSKKMIKRENPIGKTKVNRFFLEKYEKCEKIHEKRVLAPYFYAHRVQISDPDPFLHRFLFHFRCY